MPKTIPIYTDHDEKYRADACRPLVEAAAANTAHIEVISHGHYPGKPLGVEVLPGLKMAGFWDARSDQDWGLPWHRNEGVELTFLETGTLEFSTEGHELVLKSNDLTVVRPWQRHRVGNPTIKASRLHWLLIDVGVRRPHQTWKWPSWLSLSPLDLEELTKMLRQNEQPSWKTTPEIRRCFQLIAQAIESDSNGSCVSRIGLRLNELFLLLLEMLRQKDIRLDESLTTSCRTVELFLNDLRSHPEHLALSWTVEKMANSCGLGITQFIHHVKCLVNMTPMHYLVHCRLELAAKLLRTRPAGCITETALECGFSTGQYFATVFTRRYGLSPREYRNNGCIHGRSYGSVKR